MQAPGGAQVDNRHEEQGVTGEVAQHGQLEEPVGTACRPRGESVGCGRTPGRVSNAPVGEILLGGQEQRVAELRGVGPGQADGNHVEDVREAVAYASCTGAQQRRNRGARCLAAARQPDESPPHAAVAAVAPRGWRAGGPLAVGTKPGEGRHQNYRAQQLQRQGVRESAVELQQGVRRGRQWQRNRNIRPVRCAQEPLSAAAVAFLRGSAPLHAPCLSKSCPPSRRTRRP